jgi:RimJ/RimL family protein N-acetyltransferase
MSDTFVPRVDPRPDDRPWPVLAWPPPAGIVLQGHLVELTPADPHADAPGLFAAFDHDVVWRHVYGRPADVAACTAMLRTRFEAGWIPWIVRLKRGYLDHPAGEIVGTSNYLDVAPSDARLEIGGTSYTPSLWGSLVNPDTKLTLLRYAFDELGAGRVQLKTDIRNERSQRAIDRLGASYEGTLRRYQRRADATMRDTVVFSIVVEQWPSVCAGLQARMDAG